MMRASFFTSIALVLVLALQSGCGTVHPQADYARADTYIRNRTGSEQVYDPQSDAAIEQRVQDILKDGLSADEAVQVALLNNKDFQSRFYEIGVSKADLVQSALLSNPTLSFSARFPEGGGRSNLSFGLAQELVDLWQIPVRKRIAKDQLEQTVYRVVMSGIDLSTRTKQAYYKLRVLQQTENILGETVTLLQSAQNLANNRFQAGEASILDVNLVRSNVFEATMRLESVRGDERAARAAFERLLGLSNGQAGVVLTDPLAFPDAPIADEAELLEQALHSRVDVRIAAADLDAAEAEIKRQRRAVVPSVAVGVDGERPDARAPRSLKPLPPAPPKADLSGVTASQTLNEAITQLARARQTQSQALGQNAKDLMLQQLDAARGRKLEKRQTVDLLLGPSIQITVPVWDQNRAQIAKAQYRYVQKQKDYAELVLGIVQDVKQTLATLDATRELLRISRNDALPLAEQNVGTAQRVYEAGEDSILALLVAQQNYNAQREANIKLLGDYAGALADLDRAIGGRQTTDTTQSTPVPEAK
jgi:outer membrane protein TolC